MTKTHSLVALLLAFCSVGCGRFQNDRDARWCVEEPKLAEPAMAAADEWRARSANARTGQVNFSFYVSHDCSDAVARIVVSSSVPARAIGSMGAYPGYAALEIGPAHVDRPRLRITMLHEFGHFLVGERHSDNPADVMHWRDEGAEHLTDADVAMLDDYGASWEQ